MSLKSRISRLEGKCSSETNVIVFETKYEGQDGSVEATSRLAVIDFGSGQTVTTSQLKKETQDEFEERLNWLQSMGFSQALSTISKAKEEKS